MAALFLLYTWGIPACHLFVYVYVYEYPVHRTLPCSCKSFGPA